MEDGWPHSRPTIAAQGKALCCAGNNCNKDLWVLTVSLSFPTALTQTTYGATKLGMLKRLGAWETVSLKRFQIENHMFFLVPRRFLLDAVPRLSPTHTISSYRLWWRFSSLIGSFPSAAHSWADHFLLDELHCQSYHEPLKSSRCVTAPNAVDLGALRCMVHDHGSYVVGMLQS